MVKNSDDVVVFDCFISEDELYISFADIKKHKVISFEVSQKRNELPEIISYIQYKEATFMSYKGKYKNLALNKLILTRNIKESYELLNSLLTKKEINKPANVNLFRYVDLGDLIYQQRKSASEIKYLLKRNSIKEDNIKDNIKENTITYALLLYSLKEYKVNRYTPVMGFVYYLTNQYSIQDVYIKCNITDSDELFCITTKTNIFKNNNSTKLIESKENDIEYNDVFLYKTEDILFNRFIDCLQSNYVRENVKEDFQYEGNQFIEKMFKKETIKYIKKQYNSFYNLLIKKANVLIYEILTLFGDNICYLNKNIIVSKKEIPISNYLDIEETFFCEKIYFVNNSFIAFKKGYTKSHNDSLLYINDFDNFKAPITKKGIIDYLTKNILPEDTIKNSENIFDFLLFYETKDELLIRNESFKYKKIRYYVSKHGDGMIEDIKFDSFYNKIIERKVIQNGIVECCNVLQHKDWKSNIDYSFYIKEIYKFIEPFKIKQLKLF